jgi:hypothetical protein
MKKFSFLLLFVGALNFAHAQLITNDLESRLPSNPRDLYIDLMKHCLVNTIYAVEDTSCDPIAREKGQVWPRVGHTMIGTKRLENIHFCMRRVLEQNVPGDFLEAGVWRGGSTIFMRAVLKAYGDTKRKVWAADSFAGLPAPNPQKYPADAGMNLHGVREMAVSLDKVQDNFRKYDLLDKQVYFLRGFFSETLPTAPIESLAVLRLDADLYESTMDALESLYPKVSSGGFVIVDDYISIPSVAKAVDDYRKKHNIAEPLISIDWIGVYWRKN